VFGITLVGNRSMSFHATLKKLADSWSRSRADRGTIALLSRTINQRGEVVQILKAKLVVPRRAAS
jgi:acyl dehydratase